jgi:type I restriction enzyme, S subunit
VRSWTRLGEVLAARTGQPVDPDGTYAIAGVYGFSRGLLLRTAIKGADTSYRTLTQLREGDVVYSKVKAFEGAITVVPQEGDGRFVSPEFPVFAVADSVDRSYLRHALAWEGFQEQIKATSKGLGARRERVHPSTFCGLQMPLPDLDEQRRIATHLDRVSRVQAGQPLFDGTALIDAALSKLDWSGQLRDFVRLDVDEVEVRPDDAYRIIGILSHGRGVLERGSMQGADTKYTSLNRARGGQVVLSRLKAFEGAVAVVPDHLDGTVVSKEFPTFTLEAGTEQGFVSVVVSSTLLADYMRSASTGVGARRERLSVEAFLQLPAPRASSTTQRSLARVGSQIGQLRAVRRHRNALFRALLPAARNEVFSAMR